MGKALVGFLVGFVLPWRWRRRYRVILGIFVAVVMAGTVVVGVVPWFISGPATQVFADSNGGSEGSMPFVVATFNLAHGRGDGVSQVLTSPGRQRQHLAKAAALLQQEQAAVVLLQEVDGHSWWNYYVDLAAELSAELGWQPGLRASAVRGFGLDYGNAVLSKWTLRHGQARAWQGGWRRPAKGVMWAQVVVDGQTVTVVNVHLDHGSLEHRRQQADDLTQWLAEVRGPLIVGGDFNADWNAPEDAVRRLAKALQLRPWPLAAETAATFGKDRRLDWILVSSHLRIGTVTIFADAPSDHALVAVTVDWAGAADLSH